MRKTFFYVRHKATQKYAGRTGQAEYRNRASANKMAEHANSFAVGGNPWEVIETPDRIDLTKDGHWAQGVSMYVDKIEGGDNE